MHKTASPHHGNPQSFGRRPDRRRRLRQGQQRWLRHRQTFLNITAVSGTSPTLDIKFQDSYDGTNWVDVASGAFAQKNATGVSSLVLSTVGPYLRAVQDVGGTSPSFTYDLYVAGVNPANSRSMRLILKWLP